MKKSLAFVIIFLLIGMSFIVSTGTTAIKKSTMSTARGDYGLAYCIYDPSGQLEKGPVWVDLDNPDNIEQISSGSINVTGGYWFGTMYKWYVSDNDGNIWTIDAYTGEPTFIGKGNESLYGLTYNYETCTLYGCSKTDLYSINIHNGKQTHIGAFNISGGGHMIGIAANFFEGGIYGIDMISDSLYLIDPATAETFFIGQLGIDIIGLSDMEIDPDDDGYLYLSAFTTQGELYICDIETGDCTLIGAFQGGAQLTGLAIIFPTGNPVPVAEFNWTPLIPAPNQSIIFDASDSYDPLGGNISLYEWDWNNDRIYDESSTNPITFHIWDEYGDYSVSLCVYLACYAFDTITKNVGVWNHLPNKPSIDGPSHGKVGVKYNWTFVSIDPDGDDVYYLVQWGDGCGSQDWVGPYPSGEEITINHTYNREGTFVIFAKAVDIYDAESDWSTFEITMPRNKILYASLFLKFLDRFPLIKLLFDILGVI
jgi:hypothetical protein